MFEHPSANLAVLPTSGAGAGFSPFVILVQESKFPTIALPSEFPLAVVSEASTTQTKRP